MLLDILVIVEIFTDLHNLVHVNVFFFCCRTLYTDMTGNTYYNHIYIHIASYQLGFKYVSCLFIHGWVVNCQAPHQKIRGSLLAHATCFDLHVAWPQSS